MFFILVKWPATTPPSVKWLLPLMHEVESDPARRWHDHDLEMLGLDPFYVANEGKLVAIVPEAHAEAIDAAAVLAQHLGRLGAPVKRHAVALQESQRRIVDAIQLFLAQHLHHREPLPRS